MLLSVATFASMAMLIASAIGKFTGASTIGQTMAQWGSLKVPRPLINRHLVRAHPYVELLIALALAASGALGLVAAIITAALLVCYSYFLYRGIRSGIAAHCSCFGDSHRVTWYSLLRNGGFFIFALMAIADHLGAGGGIAGAVHRGGFGEVTLGALLVGAGVCVVVGMSRGEEQKAAPPTEVRAEGSSDDDYVAEPLRNWPIRNEAGNRIFLPDLVAEAPALLINVSLKCHKCAETIEQIPQWEDQFGTLMNICVLSADPPAALLAEYPQLRGRAYHDDLGIIAPAYQLATPSAMLLGFDRTISGGPVNGASAVAQFVTDIYGELAAAGLLDTGQVHSGEEE